MRKKATLKITIHATPCLPGQRHEAAPESARQADGVRFTVDYTCKKCGASGSVAINPADINW